MRMTALSSVLALLLAAGVPWTRNYSGSFAQAEEGARPVLLFFAGACGGGHKPASGIMAEESGPIEHQEGDSACDRMQQDVWEDPTAVAAAPHVGRAHAH
jgi:hypothetical protein